MVLLYHKTAQERINLHTKNSRGKWKQGSVHNHSGSPTLYFAPSLPPLTYELLSYMLYVTYYITYILYSKQ